MLYESIVRGASKSMSMQKKLDSTGDTLKTCEEIEQAFNHLMEQFRQINDKYGLIVDEEINDMYAYRLASIDFSKRYMEKLETKTITLN